MYTLAVKVTIMKISIILRRKAMSAYPENMFVEAFAERTKENLRFIEDKVKEEKNEGKSSDEISIYETTQLINSLIGLLVFPKEEYFDLLESNTTFNDEEASNIFHKYLENSGKYTYISTYMTRDRSQVNNDPKLIPVKKEDFTVKFLVRRLRNAVSHNGMKIIPEVPQVGKDIEYIIFLDKGMKKIQYTKEVKKTLNNRDIEYLGEFQQKKKKKVDYDFERFKIRISISDLKILLNAICDVLLKAAEKAKGQ